jgi:hypothetical protein
VRYVEAIGGGSQDLHGRHLWWRYWSGPHYQLQGFWFEGEDLVDDFITAGQDLMATLDDFDRGVFLFVGERWWVRWMDDDASRAFRVKHGLEVYRR